MHGGWHGAGVPWVADAQRGFKRAMGNSGFGFLSNEIENGGARGLAARARRGGNGDEREEGFGDRETPAEGRIDKVEKSGVGEAGIQVHQLGGIDDGATAHGEEGSWLIGLRKVNCFADAMYICSGWYSCAQVD